MAYSVDVTRAKYLAEESHKGQVDKSGVDYIEHPARVAMRVHSPEAKVVAWLHDVVEGTGVTLDEIRASFGPDTADAVDAVSRRKNESWSDYLCRVKANDLATEIKISDLIDNSNISRLPAVTTADIRRQAKYNRALMFLMETDG